MFYYRHHIGDFNHATRHLSRVERLIYRDLLDVYYDTEKPLPVEIDRLAKIALVPKKEMKELENVLSEFFTLTDDGYQHGRCDHEIAEFYKRGDQARENGKRGGRPHKPKTNQTETNSVNLGNPEITQSVKLGYENETHEKANQNQNQNQNQETPKPLESFSKDFYTPFAEVWETNLPELEKGPIFAVERAAQAVCVTYPVEQICKAIENYATVLKSEKHRYSYRFTLANFLKTQVPQFLNSMKPLENFLIVEKPAAKNSEANQVWENILKLAAKSFSQETYQGLPERTKIALKAVGGITAVGQANQSLLPRLKSQFVEVYAQSEQP